MITTHNEYISVEQAVDELKRNGLFGEYNYPDQKLKSLLKEGTINGIAPSYPKEGWKVDSKSLDDFIQLQKADAEFLRSKVEELQKALERKHEEYISALNRYMPYADENKELKAKIEMLENQNNELAKNVTELQGTVEEQQKEIEFKQRVIDEFMPKKRGRKPKQQEQTIEEQATEKVEPQAKEVVPTSTPIKGIGAKIKKQEKLNSDNQTNDNA